VSAGAAAPLGMRDNNPWNLQQAHIPWLGLAPDQAPAGELVFLDLVDGIRAGVRLCWTYQSEGKDTPLKFVTSFSPASAGNPTAQYVANVCKWSGFDFDQAIDFHDPPTLIKWARCIWRQEQGQQFAESITDEQIMAAIKAAEESQ